MSIFLWFLDIPAMNIYEDSYMFNSKLILFVLTSMLVTSCASYNQKNEIYNEPGALDLIICEEPRPKICTREYNPVCATLRDGSTVTGATGCTSCSDPDVMGYKKGAC
jgi:hypothetical protein